MTENQVHQENQRKLTYGEKAVGITFNPSNDDKVHQIKSKYAEIINMLNDLRTEKGQCEASRLASVGITEAQGAQMWAVKAITWKD